MREPAVVCDPLGAEEVLDRDGDPAQRPVAPTAALLGAPEVGVELVAGRGLAPGVEVLLAAIAPRLRSAPPPRRRSAPAAPPSGIGLRRRDAERARRPGPAPAPGPPRAASWAAARRAAARSPARPHARSARRRPDPARRSGRRARGSPTAPRPSSPPRPRRAAAAPASPRAALAPARSRRGILGAPAPRGLARAAPRLAVQPVIVPRHDAGSESRGIRRPEPARCWPLSFAVVGILFIAVPSGVLDTISDLGDSLGSFTRAPHTQSSSGWRSPSPTWS